MMWSQILSSVRRSHYCSSYFLCHLRNIGKRQFHCLDSNVLIKTNKKVPVNFIEKPLTQSFHLSPVRHVPIPPILWLIMKPVSKLLALITGRGLRKWWQSLPADKKQYFIKATRRNYWKIGGVISLTAGITVVYYYSHIQETPYTRRKRFVVFTPEKCKEVAQFEYELLLETNKSSLLHKDHPSCKRIATVANRLLRANNNIKELQDKDWRIIVIDEDVRNAFVLPTGQIFVFTGMLNLCENDDQLGVILAHEMAHCVLSHAVENLSYSQFLDVAAIVMIAIIWTIMPTDLVAFAAQWFFNKIVEISLQLPYSRKLEVEADEIGLQLAAKACFDVREGSAFWAKVAAITDDETNIEWLSTHPSNETRVSYLDSIMDKNIELRKHCGCPSLMHRDPRLSIDLFRKSIQEARKHKDNEKLIREV